MQHIELGAILSMAAAFSVVDPVPAGYKGSRQLRVSPGAKKRRAKRKKQKLARKRSRSK